MSEYRCYRWKDYPGKKLTDAILEFQERYGRLPAAIAVDPDAEEANLSDFGGIPIVVHLAAWCPMLATGRA